MDRYASRRLTAILVTGIICLIGHLTMFTTAVTETAHSLILDDVPVAFNDDKTMYLDTVTSERAFIIYNDHLRIRSEHLTFWDFNETYEHDDICLVTESYTYAVVPAENLTLDSITEINRFEFYAWNGTVGVKCSSYATNRMILEINSTDNATLLIRPDGLSHGYEYRVLIDGAPVGWERVNSAGYFEYNYTGDWSNHTVTFTLIGRVTAVPAMYLNIIQLFLYLGVFVVVGKEMLLPITQKRMRPEEVTRRLINAAVYIIVGLAVISLVFKLFVGV